jgi:hypothetical protein
MRDHRRQGLFACALAALIALPPRAWVLYVCPSAVTCTPVDPEHLTKVQCLRYARPHLAVGALVQCREVRR